MTARIHITLTVICVALLSFFSCNGAQADDTTTTTVVEKHSIISAAPKVGVCTTVSAHWEDNVWLDTQTVCKYQDRVEGAAWVQDYWACTAFTAEGVCTAWEYRPGHWIKTYP